MILFTSTIAPTRGRRSASGARHRSLATPRSTSRIPPPALTAPSTIWSPPKSARQKWKRLLGSRAASSTNLSGVQPEFKQRIQAIVAWLGRPGRSQRLRLRRESPTPAPTMASESGPGTALALAVWVMMVTVSKLFSSEPYMVVPVPRVIPALAKLPKYVPDPEIPEINSPLTGPLLGRFDARDLLRQMVLLRKF